MIFCVYAPQEPGALDSLKMEVGIEDCLHIEFEYDKSAYHLQDVVIGKVRVLWMRVDVDGQPKGEPVFVCSPAVAACVLGSCFSVDAVQVRCTYLDAAR